jgi:flagellar biogenesis protein FliO
MAMTRTCSSGAIPLFRGIAAVFLMSLTMAAFGGENGAASPSAPGQKEAFRQAMRNAEEELRDYGAEADNQGAWSLSAILSLVALAMAVGLAAWMTRRLRGRGWAAAPEKEMRIIERLSLGRQSALLIVEVGGRRYWVADHPRGIALLGECPPIRNPGGTPPPPNRLTPPVHSAPAFGEANSPAAAEADSGASGLRHSQA